MASGTMFSRKFKTSGKVFEKNTGKLVMLICTSTNCVRSYFPLIHVYTNITGSVIFTNATEGEYDNDINGLRKDKYGILTYDDLAIAIHEKKLITYKENVFAEISMTNDSSGLDTSRFDIESVRCGERYIEIYITQDLI